MLFLSVAALGLTFFGLHAAAVPLASPDAIASLMANLPAEHAAGLASLMARTNNPSALESLIDKRQNSSMSSIIDSYIINLKQAGFVPNANTTALKRDTLSLDSLIEKRSTPSIPLVIDLLEQHGFVPVNGTTSKRDLSHFESALGKRALPDISLVVSRLQAHGFVPSGNSSQSSIAKRNTTSEVDTIISQLEARGFNPNDYMQGNYSAFSSTNSTSPVLSSANSTASATSISIPTEISRL